jgi:hypothetical protein
MINRRTGQLINLRLYKYILLVDKLHFIDSPVHRSIILNDYTVKQPNNLPTLSLSHLLTL